MQKDLSVDANGWSFVKYNDEIVSFQNIYHTKMSNTYN